MCYSNFLLRCVLLIFLELVFACRTYSQAPYSQTQSAGPVGRTNAVLNGMTVPRGSATVAWFEYGLDMSYGASTPALDASNGQQVIRISSPIYDLSASTVYHFRLVASNSFGVSVGADAILVTGTKTATYADPVRGYADVPPGLTNLVKIACGHGHCLGITTEGNVVGWFGVISAYYPAVGQTTIPLGLTNVVAVAAGFSHSLALLPDGTVAIWGKYINAQQPVFVPTNLTNVIAIAGGDSHCLALKRDGSIVGWGDNSYGQITIPAAATNIVAISAGSTHSIALRADGKVLGWGSSFSISAIPPANLTNVVAIASETWHNLALQRNGVVVAWGDSSGGKTTVPASATNIVAIAAGFTYSLSVKSNSTLSAWGAPGFVTNLPSMATNVIAIAGGDYHATILTPQNLPPLSFSIVSAGLWNADLLLTLFGKDPNGDLLTSQVSTLPGRGTLYQFNGTGRGSPITNVNTIVTDPSNRVIFAPDIDSIGAPYTTFTYITSDGEFSSPPSTFTINVVPPPVLHADGFGTNSNGAFSLSFDGLIGVGYVVRASTDFSNWTSVGRATESPPGHFAFNDTNAKNFLWRYYSVFPH
jgi:hypothetical protein